MQHSHSRNFSPILFKITDKVQLSLPMFGIENQQDRSIISGQKSGPRSRKIAALVSEPGSEVPGSNPGGGEILHFVFIVIMNVNRYKLFKTDLMTEYIINT